MSILSRQGNPDSPAHDSLESIARQLLASIPRGRVTTYGELARIAGYPGYARQVGRILKNLPTGTGLPWHRVITASGHPAFPAESAAFRKQLCLLAMEGIPVVRGRVPRATDSWLEWD